ncbi:MAG: methionyl-tRNA formyltransferase [Steroidobacteraceae bacterium]
MRIAFAGTPEFALPALAALAASPHSLAGVLTQPDRPSGRGRHLKPSAVKQAALALGIPVAQPQTLRTESAQAALAQWRPDAIVVVAYGLLLPQTVLGLPRFGCLNIHASLLPRWRGAAPIQRAILAGDAQTGVTIMQMDRGLDTGPILAQRPQRIDRAMTSAALHTRLAALGAEALLETLAALERRAAQAHAQPAEGVTYAARIEKAEALIDWHASAAEIERRVLAFNPWPVAETRLDGVPLRILAARTSSEVHAAAGPAAPAGTIVELRRDAIVVCCGAGCLQITTLQRAGRKPLDAGAFMNAGQLSVGQRLG